MLELEITLVCPFIRLLDQFSLPPAPSLRLHMPFLVLLSLCLVLSRGVLLSSVPTPLCTFLCALFSRCRSSMCFLLRSLSAVFVQCCCLAYLLVVLSSLFMGLVLCAALSSRRGSVGSVFCWTCFSLLAALCMEWKVIFCFLSHTCHPSRSFSVYFSESYTVKWEDVFLCGSSSTANLSPCVQIIHVELHLVILGLNETELD